MKIPPIPVLATVGRLDDVAHDEYAVDDFMSEAASDVEVFATTEGHGDVCAEEIRFLARDPQAHDRVMSRVARLPRRVLRRLLRAAGPSTCTGWRFP